MKRMKARYHGECVECGGAIERGDRIAYGGRNNVAHAACARDEVDDEGNTEDPRIKITHDAASGLYLAEVNRYDDGAKSALRDRGLRFHYGDVRCKQHCAACLATSEIPENVYHTKDVQRLRGLEGYMDAGAKTALKAHLAQATLPLAGEPNGAEKVSEPEPPDTPVDVEEREDHAHACALMAQESGNVAAFLASDVSKAKLKEVERRYTDEQRKAALVSLRAIAAGDGFDPMWAAMGTALSVCDELSKRQTAVATKIIRWHPGRKR